MSSHERFLGARIFWGDAKPAVALTKPAEQTRANNRDSNKHRRQRLLLFNDDTKQLGFYELQDWQVVPPTESTSFNTQVRHHDL